MKTIKKGQWIKYKGNNSWHQVSKINNDTIVILKNKFNVSKNTTEIEIIILDIEDIRKIGEDKLISERNGEFFIIEHRSMKSIKQLLSEYNCSNWFEGVNECELILIK
jgi:pyruvate dehydrogenase complex dehydrogenase (E1) component